METEIIEKMKELSGKMVKPKIIAIIYNPYREEGMKMEDIISLKSLMSGNVYNSPLFVLSGHGGSFEAGVNFPYIIKQSVKSYKVFIPSVCASALGFMLFLSDEFLITEDSRITQLDPLLPQDDGQVLRAVDYMNGKIKDDLRNSCKDAFNISRDNLIKICKDSKLFKFENWEEWDFDFREQLEIIFMKKEEHESPVTKRELDLLEIKYKIVPDEIRKTSLELISLCRSYLKDQDARVMFVSSKPFERGTDSGSESASGIFVS